jgi:Kef-type K+ transport system membrane component KefB/mannitol/fructose-specific phosphotransferase system IIA component
MTLTTTDIVIFLVGISVILFFGRGVGELIKKFKQPIVLGEIIAGIILGPTILGSVFPQTYDFLFNHSEQVIHALNGITLLGVVLLMLVSGLEINLTLVLKQSKSSSIISLFGILFPFSMGFFTAYFFPNLLGVSDIESRLIFSLFIGIAISITALPVVARTLMDLNIFKTEIGFSIMTSAMINDVIGWIFFSVLLGMMGQQSGNGLNLPSLLITIIVFTFFVLIILRKLIDYLLPWLQKNLTFPGGVLNFIIIIGFLGAALTEYIGMHAIFGAFLVGIAIGDSAHLSEETRETINQFITNIFAPLFFVSIGLRINFIENFDLIIVLIFIGLSFTGKVFGSTFGARLSGFNKYDALTIGFGLNSHGAIEIVLGTLAFQVGLIQEKVFVALVIMALITSISSAPIMSYFIKKSRKQFGFAALLNLNNVFFTNATSKTDVIKELCSVTSKLNKIDYEKIFSEVMKREELISTGLEKHLAIPHARLEIQKPFAAIAICKQGIDFDSLDKLPAKVIILLVTPKEKPEIQLNMLSEIAKKIGQHEIIEKLVDCKNEQEIISKVKQLY